MTALLNFGTKRLNQTLLTLLFASSSIVTLKGQVVGVGSLDLRGTINQHPYSVSGRGPHHRIWQRETWFTNATDGSIRVVTNSFTELRTGMSHLVAGKWIDSDPTIAITPTGAQGTNTQHSVAFLGDLTSPGSVDVTTPDGNHLKSNILGLSYYDTATGNAIFFADLQSSVGQLLPSGTEVIYPNAFSGCDADVEYENSLVGCEQLIVLHSQLPSPTKWGLNPETTMLQVITEYLNPPSPQIAVSDEDSQDQTLDFGLMKMGKGAAFALGAETNIIPVTKQWLILDGRTCLIEQVPLQPVLPFLRELPSAPAGTAKIPSASSTPTKLAELQLPAPKKRTDNSKSVKLATLLPKNKGFAIDWFLALNNQTNVVLQSDTTYHVTGRVLLSGTNNIIEGLTVIKFTNSPLATISASSIIWKTGPYTPAVFTSQDDDQVGETVPHGIAVGPWTNYYAGIALDLSSATNAQVVPNVRFCYLSNAVAGANITLQNCQLIHCLNGFSANSVQPVLLNVLIYQVNKVFANTSAATLTCENVTAHYCTNFVGNTSGTINLTNCILACVTNWQCTTTSTNTCVVVNSDLNLFQTVGGGLHYLAVGSPYRSAGTTNISPALLADLIQQTTYAPNLYSNTFVLANTTLTPQVRRDACSPPDLGYHYYPLDYLMGEVIVTNSSALVAGPGTCIGLFSTYASSFAYYNSPIGVLLYSNCSFSANGMANAKVRMVEYNIVQETVPGDGGNWIETWDGMVTDDVGCSGSFRFTDFSCFPGPGFGSSLINTSASAFDFKDCVINAPFIFSSSSIHMTNCLFKRVVFNLLLDYSTSEPPGSPGPSFRNNLFYGGICYFSRGQFFNGVLYLRDNNFDRTILSNIVLTNFTYTAGYNAFVTNFDRLQPTSAGDVVLAAPMIYQTGPLGSYYEPTNNSLVNAGSTTADLAGLYHYSVLTTQTKETNSIVDIGFHYVALDGTGKPFDSDGDGVPDYLEDLNGNGNGADDPTSWQLFDSPNGLTGTATLQVFTPLK